MGLQQIMLVGALLAPCQAPLVVPNEASYTTDRRIEIPFTFDPVARADIKEMVQYVSRDGKRWESYTVTKPTQESVEYKATEDGTYYFLMVVVDKKGNRDIEDLTKPDVVNSAKKVVVDTKPPVVTIRSAEKVGDDVTVSWEIAEANPDNSKFALEYKGGDETWYPIQGIEPRLISSARFAIASTEKISVRVRIADKAGQSGEAVKEVAGSGAASTSMSPAADAKLPAVAPAAAKSPLDLPTLPAMAPIALPEMPASTGYSPTAPAVMATPPAAEVAASAPANTTPAGAPLPAAQVINVTKFDLGYDVEGRGASGLSKAELYVTRDEGKSWLRWAVTDIGDVREHKFPVNLEMHENRANKAIEGIYGFKIVLASGAGLTRGAPLSGEVPEIRVDVDVTKPDLKLFRPVPDPNQRGTMVINWKAEDRNLAAEPITLEWSETADGPWYPVNAERGEEASAAGKRLANTGSYAWKVPGAAPPKVFLRICARDTAGNIAELKTPEPVLIDMSKPTARIQGIVSASGADR